MEGEESIFEDLKSDTLCIALPKEEKPPTVKQILGELKECGMYPYQVNYKDEDAKKAAEEQGYVFHFTVMCLKTAMYEC